MKLEYNLWLILLYSYILLHVNTDTIYILISYYIIKTKNGYDNRVEQFILISYYIIKTKNGYDDRVEQLRGEGWLKFNNFNTF